MTARSRYLACLAAFAVGACGVPVDDAVQRTHPDDVPFDLLAPRAAETNTTQVAAVPVGDSFGAYFIRNGQLVEVITMSETTATPETAIAALLRGPSAEDGRRGLRTALVGDRLVTSIGTVAGTASVDLGQGFGELASREQLLALGQIVMTLTTLRGIGSVSFTVEGKRIEVRVGDGSLEQGSVSRDDYASLLRTG